MAARRPQTPATSMSTLHHIVDQKEESATGDTFGVQFSPAPRPWSLSRAIFGNARAFWRPLKFFRGTTARWLATSAALGGAGVLLALMDYSSLPERARNFPAKYLLVLTARLFQYDLALVFLPLARHPAGLFPRLLGSSFEYLMSMHRVAGDVAIGLGLAHTVAVLAFAVLRDKPLIGLWTKPSHREGIFAMVAMIVMRILTLQRVRNRTGHEFFYFTHVALWLVLLRSLSHHHGVTRMWIVLCAPLLLWLADCAWRAWHAYRGRGAVVRKTTLPRSQATVIDLDFPRFSFAPGQWANVCFAGVSREYHPMTMIASSLAAAREGKNLRVRLLIKELGDWSQRVAQSPFEKIRNGQAYAVGPFGRRILSVEEYRFVVLVGGGTGFATALGIMQNAVLMRSRGATSPSSIWLLGIAKDRELFVPFDNNITELAGESGVSVSCYETAYSVAERPTIDEDCKGMRIAVKIGRPDLREYFGAIADEASRCSVSRVGVISSGPSRLQDAVVEACASHGNMFNILLEAESWFD